MEHWFANCRSGDKEVLLSKGEAEAKANNRVLTEKVETD
jgi:hypothetical protein